MLTLARCLEFYIGKSLKRVIFWYSNFVQEEDLESKEEAPAVEDSSFETMPAKTDVGKLVGDFKDKADVWESIHELVVELIAGGK